MTLQKEFYANFIVQRLTLKVINMDTLYLVFKDRFQLLLLPYRREFLVPSKKTYYRTTPYLSSNILHSCKLFSGMKQPPSQQNPYSERNGSNMLSVAWMSTAVFTGKEGL
jgi:hypothetical protein